MFGAMILLGFGVILVMSYEYVNCVGYSPDCVDRAMLDDGDGCPEGTLPSVPVCFVTDDMTYQRP